MNKKSVLWIGFLGVIVFITSVFSIDINLCPPYSYSSCSQFFSVFGEIIFVFTSLFLLSLITYKMRDDIFQSWFKLVRIWVPLTIILVLISPEYGNSLFPIEKGSVSFFMSVLFLIISIILIIYKSLSLRKT